MNENQQETALKNQLPFRSLRRYEESLTVSTSPFFGSANGAIFSSG